MHWFTSAFIESSASAGVIYYEGPNQSSLLISLILWWWVSLFIRQFSQDKKFSQNFHGMPSYILWTWKQSFLLSKTFEKYYTQNSPSGDSYYTLTYQKLIIGFHAFKYVSSTSITHSSHSKAANNSMWHWNISNTVGKF